jgi:hypothetical protein
LRRAYLYLVDLILEAAEEYPTGVLEGVDADVLADICGYEGRPAAFLEAMIGSEWLDNLADPDGALVIVSWEKWGGRAIKKRETERERKRRNRAGSHAEKGNVPRDTHGTPAEVPPVSAIGADRDRESNRDKTTERDPARLARDGDPLEFYDVERIGFKKYGALGGIAAASMRRLGQIYPWELRDAMATEGNSWRYAARVIESAREETAKGASVPGSRNKPVREGAFASATRRLLEDPPNDDRDTVAGIRAANDPATGLLPSPGK